MRYEYREVNRFWAEQFPKLAANEKIVSASIDGPGDPYHPPVMVIVIEKSIPFYSRIRK